MINRILSFCLFITLLYACNADESWQKAQDAEEAGTQFIRAMLDGNYDKAKFFMLKDDDNMAVLDRWKREYQKYSADTVRKFKNASIRPVSITPLNDSTTSYTYSNSFTNDTVTLKVLRINTEWLVDLKTFLSN